jgi:hypothetical protein
MNPPARRERLSFLAYLFPVTGAAMADKLSILPPQIRAVLPVLRE